ncbi:hypothetical protein ESCAB7627_2329 [Escherichia albertii TW07627]|uniref:Uncharacterized protein n=1 Tax=Escherichia albertii (strain TW07627) TaxID=502347 RepID=A0ABC9NN47_ESCAT|nr:hypothetical protein ESCAB7627_2329 [Escherichia albertii TW07627]
MLISQSNYGPLLIKAHKQNRYLTSSTRKIAEKRYENGLFWLQEGKLLTLAV